MEGFLTSRVTSTWISIVRFRELRRIETTKDNSKSLLDEDFEDGPSLIGSDSEDEPVSISHNESHSIVGRLTKNTSFVKQRAQSPILNTQHQFNPATQTRPSNSLYNPSYNSNYGQTNKNPNSTTHENTNSKQNDNMVIHGIQQNLENKQMQMLPDKFMNSTRFSNNTSNPNPMAHINQSGMTSKMHPYMHMSSMGHHNQMSQMNIANNQSSRGYSGNMLSTVGGDYSFDVPESTRSQL